MTRDERRIGINPTKDGHQGGLEFTQFDVATGRTDDLAVMTERHGESEDVLVHTRIVDVRAGQRRATCLDDVAEPFERLEVVIPGGLRSEGEEDSHRIAVDTALPPFDVTLVTDDSGADDDSGGLGSFVLGEKCVRCDAYRLEVLFSDGRALPA